MRIAPFCVLLSLALPACIANDDAGDAAFVSRAVPAVLGRKVHGAVELDILTQVAQTWGREALIDVLMDQPEYTEYWTHVLAEDLEVQYGSWAGPSAQDAGCFDTANVVAIGDQAAADDLATFLRNSTPGLSSYSTPFTMLDALRAGVMADDLLSPYIAGVFPLATHTGQDRDLAEKYFNRAYLGKDADCYACHSSTWSTTDDVGGWDRFAPFPIDVEAGLYDALPAPHTTCGATDVACRVYAAYCSNCHGALGTTVKNAADGDDKVLAQRVRVMTDAGLLGVMAHGSGNMSDPGVSDAQALAILSYLRRVFGSAYDTQYYFRKETYNGSATGSQPLNLDPACTPMVSNWSYLSATDPGYPYIPMLAGAGSSAPSANHVARRVRGAGTWTATNYMAPMNVSYGNPAYASPPTYGSGNLGFAMSQQIVDNVLQEIWGERHTLGHGYERAAAQSYSRNLRAAEFMDSGWSLRMLVRSAVLSEHFNRRAPEQSLVSSTAYVLTTYLNPWAMVAPGTGTGAHEEDQNGQGDAVHRYTPDNLYWSVHHGLGWNAPDVVEPSNAAFPKYDLRQRVGDYTDYYQRGADKWALGSLLYWEDAVGTCAATNSSSGQDWVTLLLDEAYLAPSAYTVEDLVAATRDRLLSTPTLITGEESDLLAAMTSMGLPAVPNLAVPLTGYSRSQIEPFVRRYCGALLTTPDYLLGGLPLVDDIASDWPTLEVCLPGEPCGATDTCGYWADALAEDGITWTSCNDVEPPLAPPGGDGPIDPTERVSVEDAAAREYGYGTETEYDGEIEEGLYAEYKSDLAAYEAYDSGVVAKEEAERAAVASKYAAVCERNRACDEVAEAWIVGLAADAELAASDALETARPVGDDGTYVPTWAELAWEPYGDWSVRSLQETNAVELAELLGDEYAAVLAADNALNEVDPDE